MSTTAFTCKYRCWNDCLPQGCPTHEATLEFQSVSAALSFDDGKGQKMEMQPPELEAFLCMLSSLSAAHVEIGDVVETAFGGCLPLKRIESEGNHDK